MNAGKYVFAQVLSLVNRYEFQKCVDRYSGDYRTRELNCWNQFAQLFFGQLSSRNGLRDICMCLNAHKNRLYHLGIKQAVNQSSLSRANENRNWRIYADFGTYLIDLVRPLYTENHTSLSGIDKEVFVLDSTTISVSIILMDWAHGKYSRGAVKMHTLLNLRGTIPTFIHITDGKYHDVNALDEIDVVLGAVYVMDKAYVDFSRLYRLNLAAAFFAVLFSFRVTAVRRKWRDNWLHFLLLSETDWKEVAYIFEIVISGGMILYVVFDMVRINLFQKYSLALFTGLISMLLLAFGFYLSVKYGLITDYGTQEEILASKAELMVLFAFACLSVGLIFILTSILKYAVWELKGRFSH